MRNAVFLSMHTHTHTHTHTNLTRARIQTRTHPLTYPTTHTHTHTHMQRRVERARHTTDKLNVGSVSGQRYNDPPSRLPTKQAGTKSIAEHHREVEKYNEGWVQCESEVCKKWRYAPQYANSDSNFECKMVVEKGCREKEDDWRVEAFCPQARGDKVASEPSFSQKPYCEVAIRHLLHNISSRTPSFWRGEESTDDLIVKASTAETVSLGDRVDILKQIFFALTKSINKECKEKDDDYWKDIDTKINEVCHAPVCVSTH